MFVNLRFLFFGFCGNIKCADRGGFARTDLLVRPRERARVSYRFSCAGLLVFSSGSARAPPCLYARRRAHAHGTGAGGAAAPSAPSRSCRASPRAGFGAERARHPLARVHRAPTMRADRGRAEVPAARPPFGPAPESGGGVTRTRRSLWGCDITAVATPVTSRRTSTCRVNAKRRVSRFWAFCFLLFFLLALLCHQRAKARTFSFLLVAGETSDVVALTAHLPLRPPNKFWGSVP